MAFWGGWVCMALNIFTGYSKGSQFVLSLIEIHLFSFYFLLFKEKVHHAWLNEAPVNNAG